MSGDSGGSTIGIWTTKADTTPSAMMNNLRAGQTRGWTETNGDHRSGRIAAQRGAV